MNRTLSQRSKAINRGALDDHGDEVLAQIAFADRIILNKIDLITQDQQIGLKRRLQAINHMAQLYLATMAKAPIDELLDIGGFNLERALEQKPNFLEPEYPFEWGGIWQLNAGEYRLRMSNGPDPEMAIVRADASEASQEALLALAETIFVEFSRPGKNLDHHSAITRTNTHYQLRLQGRDQYEFTLLLNEPKCIALFTEHTPQEFDLKLLGKDDVEYTPLVEHVFNSQHAHDNSVSSVAIELPGWFDFSLINAWLDVFLQVQGADIYRMKGIVAVKGEQSRIVFQGVHMIFSSQAGKPWANENPLNRMVFIGKNLDETYIRRSLELCLV